MMSHILSPGCVLVAFIPSILLVVGCTKNNVTGPVGGDSGSVVAVSGMVIGENRQPAASVPVLIAGKASTKTDAAGHFTFAGITTPYNVTIVDGMNKRAIVYIGLTRPDPTLVLVGSAPGPVHTASVSGTVIGGDFNPVNQGAGDITTISFASPETISTSSINGAHSGAFVLSGLSWFGPAITNGSLYALQCAFDATRHLPVAGGFKGFGALSGIALSNGNTLNNQFDTLKSVPTVQVRGMVTVPAGYTLSQIMVQVRLNASALLPVLSDVTPSATFSYFAPDIAGGMLLLEAEAIKAGRGTTVALKTGIAAGAAGIQVSIPEAPELSLPIDEAKGVDISSAYMFSWTPFANGIHLVIFSSGGGPAYYVVTTGTSTTIPDLEGVGLGLPLTAAYTWNVIGIAPFGSVDAAAGSGGLTGVLENPQHVVSDSYLGYSALRNFTTAP